MDSITNSMNMSLSTLWELVIGQGGLACCSPWGCKESDMTEQLNWTELGFLKYLRIQDQRYLEEVKGCREGLKDKFEM